MNKKKWYKIEVYKSGDDTYHYIGTSEETLDLLSMNIKEGKFICLNDLLYFERGVYKEWAEWDKSLEPTVLINPSSIVTLMQFKDDPRNISNK